MDVSKPDNEIDNTKTSQTLFHLIQQTGDVFNVAGVHVQIEQLAFAVKELISGPAVNV
jgi:hypothetical protein